MNRLFLFLFGLVTFVAHAQVPGYVPAEGLVAWLPFDGNSDDESGNGHHADNDGAELATDRFGIETSCYFFDGTDRMFPANPEAFPLTERTVSIWMKASSQVDHGKTLYGYGGASCGTSWMVTYNNQGNLPYSENAFEVNGHCNANATSAPFDQEFITEWHQIVIRTSAEGTDIFIDGELEAHSDIFVDNTHPNCAVIGGMPSTTGACVYDDFNNDLWYGWLDDFAIWDRALSDEEILIMFSFQPVFGCLEPDACNYDPTANTEDGSCIPCSTIAEFCGEGTYWDEVSMSCLPVENCQEDLDGDGLITVNDLMQLLASFGTTCANAETPWSCGDPVNYHGYDYATVQIGEQCWFAENLKTEQYQNGDSIPGDLSSSQWTNTESGAQAVYGDDEGNLDLYGRLYNGYAMADARALCPTNWHVPSDEDWGVLELELGLDESELPLIGERGDDQGTQLKASTSDTPSWDGSNTSGFSAVANGYRHNHGYYQHLNFNSHYWSQTASEEGVFYIRVLQNSVDGVYRLTRVTNSGYTVRCVAD